MTEQATDTDVEGDVIVEVDIAAPPEVVFDHLVVSEKVMRWMGLEGELDTRPGGVFHLQITPADVARGEYLEVTPPERVVFTWGWDGSDEVPPGSSTVRIDLIPTVEGTHVQLTHSGLPGGAGDDHGTGWRLYLDRLAIAGAGGDPGPVDFEAMGITDDRGEPT